MLHLGCVHHHRTARGGDVHCDANAAEPLGVVTLAAMLSEAMALTAASSEVVAHAAELPEVGVLASAPCMVVAPSNVLSVCCVAVKETVTELSLCPEFTTVEPPEVAATAPEPPEVSATAAEPPEVSVVSTYLSSSCSVKATEAALNICPALNRPRRLSLNSRIVLNQLW